MNPGAPEVCDGVDNDCDGNVDGAPVTWYRDYDFDGYGSPDLNQSIIAGATCPPGFNYVLNR